MRDTVMAKTIVRPRVVARSAIAASHLPSTTSQSRTGIVMSSSMVPEPFSSASRRIVMAGAKKQNISGARLNSERMSACFSTNRLLKKKNPNTIVKTVTTMYATGELK